MIIFAPTLVALMLLTLGAVTGYSLGSAKGREDERRQVIAFLFVKVNDPQLYGPSDLAEQIHEGKHLQYDIK